MSGDAAAVLVFLFSFVSGALIYLSVSWALHWRWERRAGYRPRLDDLVPSGVGLVLAAVCWAVILLVLAE